MGQSGVSNATYGGASTRRQSVNVSEALGACAELRERAIPLIQAALTASLRHIASPGYIDFGFLGDEDETETCAGQNCAYTNPSSPYGLTVLPLAPNETLTGKLQQTDLPDFARQDLRQRNQGGAGTGSAASWQLLPDEVVLVAGCLPPATASRYWAWTHYVHNRHDADQASDGSYYLLQLFMCR
jgi:hypothetical protein